MNPTDFMVAAQEMVMFSCYKPCCKRKAGCEPIASEDTFMLRCKGCDATWAVQTLPSLSFNVGRAHIYAMLK